MSNDIASRVLKVIANEVEMSVDDISPEATPEQLEIDSLGMIEIIFSLEEEFDVSIPYNANNVDNTGFAMNTIQDVIDSMEKLVAESTSAK